MSNKINSKFNKYMEKILNQMKLKKKFTQSCNKDKVILRNSTKNASKQVFKFKKLRIYFKKKNNQGKSYNMKKNKLKKNCQILLKKALKSNQSTIN